MSPDKLFRLLSDPTRLRCVLMLRDETSLCVCELTYALEMSQPKVSRHLAMLREAGLVLDERRGQWVHYRLDPSLPAWALAVLDAAAAGESGAAMREKDKARLAEMESRPSRDFCAA